MGHGAGGAAAKESVEAVLAESTSGSDLGHHEGLTAVLLDTGVESCLSVEKLAVAEARGIRKVRLVVDEGLENVSGAGLAEIRGVRGEEEEEKVVGGEGAGVGDDVVA